MSDHQSFLHVVGNVAKDAPPVAIGGLLIFGVPLSDVVLVITGVYTLVRLLREVYEWNKSRRNDRSSTIHPR